MAHLSQFSNLGDRSIVSDSLRAKYEYLIGAYNPFRLNVLGVNHDTEHILDEEEGYKYSQKKALSKWQLLSNQILYKKEKFRNFLKNSTINPEM